MLLLLITFILQALSHEDNKMNYIFVIKISNLHGKIYELQRISSNHDISQFVYDISLEHSLRKVSKTSLISDDKN